MTTPTADELTTHGKNGRVYRRVPPIDRLMERLYIPPNWGCWEWTGGRTPEGYGMIWVDGKQNLVHRWAYEHWVGPIPDGLVLDHLCRNPRCVCPAHLEPVTQRVNLMRGYGVCAQNNRKKSCPEGHPFVGRGLNGGRVCGICWPVRKPL